MRARTLPIAALLIGVLALAYCFANVEVQIEGADGWAAKLPVTFRVEQHWLLDLLWGGRPMTGYHAWVFGFMALVFHLPLLLTWQWSVRLEARVVGCVMLFWIVEDFLWFVVNPAYGITPLVTRQVAWHRHYFLFLPADYWTFTITAAALLWYSFRRGRPPAPTRE
jgi:hypothetical protein